MASIYKRKVVPGVKSKERIVLPKSVSEHGGTFKFDRMDWADQRIRRLTDENRRLRLLAEILRSDITRLITWREMRH